MRSVRYLIPLTIVAALGAVAVGACSSLDPTPPNPHADDPVYPDPEVIAQPITDPTDGGDDAPEDAP